MGNHCYVRLTCRKVDRPKMAAQESGTLEMAVDNADGTSEVSFVEGRPNLDGFPGFAEERYNHETKQWETQPPVPTEGIPYFGYHGEGDDYGGRLFACDGEKLVFAACDYDSCLVCRVGVDGVPDADGMAEAREYLRVIRRAHALMGISSEPAKDNVGVANAGVRLKLEDNTAVGDLRRLIADMPDGTPLAVVWAPGCEPADADPGVCVDAFADLPNHELHEGRHLFLEVCVEGDDEEDDEG